MPTDTERAKEGKMTVAEAGRKGGEKVLKERGREFFSEIGRRGGRRSWTADPTHAARPRVSAEEDAEIRRIREKVARGEDLTTAEAGRLGGLKRVRQFAGEEGL